MYSTRSVGSCFQGTRRRVGQSPGPFDKGLPSEWAGQESNLVEPCTPPRQSSVFPFVSKGPTRVWPETLRCSAVELRRNGWQCAGGTRTHNPRLKHVLQPAVGLYSVGDEVVGQRHCGYGHLRPRLGVVNPRSRFHAIQSHVLQPAVALFHFSKRPNEVVAETLAFRGCSPGRQLGFSSRPSNEAKGSDGVILKGCSPNQAVG